ALALCCCTSVCVEASTESDTAKQRSPFPPLKGDPRITPKQTVAARNCPAASSSVSGERKKVTVSTTAILKEGALQYRKTIIRSVKEDVTVPDGYNFTVEKNVVVECVGKDGDKITKEKCTVVDGATATNNITYIATVKSTTADPAAVNTLAEEVSVMSVPDGYKMSIDHHVAVKCIPLTVTGLSPSSAGVGTPGGGDEGVLNDRVTEDVSTQLQSSIKNDTVKGEADRLASQANGLHQPPGSASHDSIANSGKINGERASEE
ncbi:hypothetical protein DQ04_23731000, partial [Trypanosoma grayi]|uniref:hypothetical protein n=1 Tax=Trypanosoma grayi TaxID=71804 RepID=UPI0004F3FF03